MLDRREFLYVAAAPRRKYRAAVIGHTGRGNYGHGWERTWNGLPGVEVAALADADEKGRKAAAARCGAARQYADYRQMLAAEKPDLVAICPRWLDRRLEMVLAAIEAGAHILVEKPFAQSVEDADRMVAAAERRGVKIQAGHTARPHPITLQVQRLIGEGIIGELMAIRARGKEDARAGGEDLMVLGTHCFDMMRQFAGDPEWVFGSVTEQGRPVRRGMERKATEPIGPVAGDEVIGMYRFARGVHGHFGSRKSDVRAGTRFGVTFCGSQGQIFVPLSTVPSAPAALLRAASWSFEKEARWELIAPPPEAAALDREAINRMMAADLIAAVEKGREPVCGARDARWTIEMAMGLYQSHLAGARVAFPLRDRRAPFAGTGLPA
ncbi:MAG: Gfo/Idh/MocA family oxidoreductase [Acidobacteria bacterium]|nr:Gfo/Idh/MocA family oxidoreductase [Acidobacteriota bacterium]